MLETMGIDSYFAAPLISPNQHMMGIVAVMDEKPMLLEDWIKPVLGIYANRIALELDRKSANDELCPDIFWELFLTVSLPFLFPF